MVKRKDDDTTHDTMTDVAEKKAAKEYTESDVKEVKVYRQVRKDGSHIRQATKVIFKDGHEVAFMDKLSKKSAIAQAVAAINLHPESFTKASLREAVSKELLQIAKALTEESSEAPKSRKAALSLLEEVLPKRDLLNLEGNIDEDTWAMAVKTYMKLAKAFELKNDQQEALNRLRQSVKRASSMDSALHRNNIFKAANALGIRLPSLSF